MPDSPWEPLDVDEIVEFMERLEAACETRFFTPQVAMMLRQDYADSVVYSLGDRGIRFFDPPRSIEEVELSEVICELREGLEDDPPAVTFDDTAMTTRYRYMPGSADYAEMMEQVRAAGKMYVPGETWRSR